MSHNTLSWHRKNINLIKKIHPDKYILVDIPGAKPRTLNIKTIKISKGQKVVFSHKYKGKILFLFQILYPKLKKIKFFLFQMEISFSN